MAFSLNLSPKEIAAANDNAKGFVDYFKRRISRLLETKLGHHPHYWFAVHSKAGRLHLHGTIAANDNEWPMVEDALRVAGGRWNSDFHKEKQVKLEDHYDPDGWVNYCLNADYTAARRLIGKAVSITGPLRRRANLHYALTANCRIYRGEKSL